MPVVSVGLIGHKHHRLLAATQDMSDLIVEIGHAVLHIDHEKNHIRLFNRDLHLLVNLSFKDVFGIDNPAPRVDNRKFAPCPFYFPVLTVTRRSRLFIDDSLTRLRQAVKQGGLADIRTSDDCYHISHILF